MVTSSLNEIFTNRLGNRADGVWGGGAFLYIYLSNILACFSNIRVLFLSALYLKRNKKNYGPEKEHIQNLERQSRRKMSSLFNCVKLRCVHVRPFLPGGTPLMKTISR